MNRVLGPHAASVPDRGLTVCGSRPARWQRADPGACIAPAADERLAASRLAIAYCTLYAKKQGSPKASLSDCRFGLTVFYLIRSAVIYLVVPLTMFEKAEQSVPLQA